MENKDINMKREKQDMKEKTYLNPGEAIRYWNLSPTKFREFIKNPALPFVALYGRRRLVVRREFEKYIRENPAEYGRIRKCS